MFNTQRTEKDYMGHWVHSLAVISNNEIMLLRPGPENTYFTHPYICYPKMPSNTLVTAIKTQIIGITFHSPFPVFCFLGTSGQLYLGITAHASQEGRNTSGSYQLNRRRKSPLKFDGEFMPENVNVTTDLESTANHLPTWTLFYRTLF